MTREEFLSELYRGLGDIPRDEAEQYLTYYAEMMADRMEEGMSEEEAVSGMESPAEIVQKIRQDRENGIKPPKTETYMPPRYPDPPGRPAGGPSPAGDAAAPRRPERPAWRRWVTPAAITGCVLGVLVLWAAVNVIIHGIYVGPEGVRVGTLVNVNRDGVQVGPLYVGPDGIRLGGGTATERVIDAVTVTGEASTEWSEHAEDAVPGSDSWWGEEHCITDEVREIQIDWTGGAVYVTADGPDGAVHFEESADRELTEANALTYTLNRGKLTIRFGGKGWENFTGDKELMVVLPADAEEALEKLSVTTVSADVMAYLVKAGEMDLSTTSGDIHLEQISAREVSAETVSGDFWMGDNPALTELSANTVSGDVTLSNPLSFSGAGGFTVEFDTVSGEMESGSISLSKSGDRYTYGKGQAEVEVDTVNGNLYLEAGY